MAGLLQQHLSKIRAPLAGDKVYKDECAFSFDNPECENGLYVCMRTFHGFGRRFVEQYFRKTGNAVFLHLRRLKKEIPISESDAKANKPTKMALGIEGGFYVDEKKYEYEDINSIVVLPEWASISIENPDLPTEVQVSAASILTASSAATQDELNAMAATWDGEIRVISKYASDLLQLPVTRKVAPRGWRCEKCELTENLWLNLTDGSILCGRRFWDGTGGNNHAVDHYKLVKHPLAVKLGTITPEGGDVYSYAEDDMVENPFLSQHLAHFGIDIMKMEKTEKTMSELEVELNQRVGEWAVLQESGSTLQPIHGAGHTGLDNLGNSCYMNAVVQMLFSIPAFEEKYYKPADTVFTDAPDDPTRNFNVQMCKLAHGLLSGEYSKDPPDESPIHHTTSIRPQMLKSLIGQGSAEFSTKRQQDAQEFLLYLITLVERNCRGFDNPVDCLRMRIEERTECMESHKVRYCTRDDYLLALPIPMNAVHNIAEVAAYEEKKVKLEAEKKTIDPSEQVRPSLTFESCLQAFASPQIIDDFYSTAIGAKTRAQQTSRLATFPDFLVVQLKKYTIGDDWLPIKLDVAVEMPDTIDLTELRASGLQSYEEQLPEDSTVSPAQPEVNINEAVVSQLVEMGFPVDACRKGVFYTENSGAEAAMNWVMAHMDDPDFNEPLQLSRQPPDGSSDTLDENSISMLMSMGFQRSQATKALKATDNNLERAADWIFSHVAELDEPMRTADDDTPSTATNVCDGSGKYKLVAFISHMGKSTTVGHYVCHIIKNGRWVIFNDEKVALSLKPPKELAYLYLYQRL